MILAGHSDVTLGYVAAKRKKHAEAIYNFVVSTGLTPSPFDCWLAERGLASFPLRFEKSQKTAFNLAKFLSSHNKVLKTLYPKTISLTKQVADTRTVAILRECGGKYLWMREENWAEAYNELFEAFYHLF